MSEAEKAIERCLALDGKAHKPRWWIGHISENHENAADIDSEDGAICDNVYTDNNRSLIIDYRTLAPQLAKALRISIDYLDSSFECTDERCDKALAEIEQAFNDHK